MPPKKKPKKKKEKPIVITQTDEKEIDTSFEGLECRVFTKMGEDVSYRENQHADYMKNFIAQFNVKPEHHVLDVGCGIGKNAAYLCDQGINVHGIDIANTLNQDMCQTDHNNHLSWRDKFYFTQDVCWLMKPDPVDFIVCTYLLENLPFIKVEPTLYLISKAMRKGAFFSISTELEPYGPQHLNKQLHRTVQSGRYWADVLTKYWRISWDCSVSNSLLVYAYPRKENNSNAWPTGY